MRAVVQDYYHWQIGWRLEDLSRQAANQRDRMKGLLESLKEFPARGGGSSSPLAAKVAGWMGAGLGGAADDDENLTPEIFLAKVLAEEEDLNRVVSVECATRPNTYVQVRKCIYYIIIGLYGCTNTWCKYNGNFCSNGVFQSFFFLLFFKLARRNPLMMQV